MALYFNIETATHPSKEKLFPKIHATFFISFPNSFFMFKSRYILSGFTLLYNPFFEHNFHYMSFYSNIHE